MNHSLNLEEPLGMILGKDVRIESTRPIGGGSISRTYAIETNNGKYFLKMNSDHNALAMFEAELDGLRTLRDNSSFGIPATFGTLLHMDNSYLLMDLIESSGRGADYWTQLGNKLAELHRNRSKSFGYHQANFIGSLPQSNQLFDRWSDFFIEQRMTPQIRKARDQGLVDSSFVSRFDTAMLPIVSEMPDEPPSLIHGDLWSGNLMIDNFGDPTVIDPAVYYGHREMDLAFSQMFGGFSDEFYSAYNNAYPMEKGFNSRIGLYNLYPYLVHLNLFGRSYFGHIDLTIRRFT